MTSTYEKIATTTLGSAASSVTFSSISSAYTDLVAVISAKATTGTPVTQFRINSDSGSNYSRTFMFGDGSSASSSRSSNVTEIGMASINATNFTPHNLSFNNYSNTTTYKTILYKGGLDYPAAQVALWRNTSAISTIDLIISSSTYTSGSTFTLYGIKAE